VRSQRCADCSRELVFRLLKLCKIPDDGLEVIGIEVSFLLLPSGLFASVYDRQTQSLAISTFPIGAWTAMRQIRDDKAHAKIAALS